MTSRDAAAPTVTYYKYNAVIMTGNLVYFGAAKSSVPARLVAKRSKPKIKYDRTRFPKKENFFKRSTLDLR